MYRWYGILLHITDVNGLLLAGQCSDLQAPIAETQSRNVRSNTKPLSAKPLHFLSSLCTTAATTTPEEANRILSPVSDYHCWRAEDILLACFADETDLNWNHQRELGRLTLRWGGVLAKSDGESLLFRTVGCLFYPDFRRPCLH